MVERARNELQTAERALGDEEEDMALVRRVICVPALEERASGRFSSF